MARRKTLCNATVAPTWHGCRSATKYASEPARRAGSYPRAFFASFGAYDAIIKETIPLLRECWRSRAVRQPTIARFEGRHRHEHSPPLETGQGPRRSAEPPLKSLWSRARPLRSPAPVSSSLSEHAHIIQIESRKSSPRCPPLEQQTAATTAADRAEDSGNRFCPGALPPDQQSQRESSTKCWRRGRIEALPSKTNGSGSHRGFPCC
jgi:hypothetical protein